MTPDHQFLIVAMSGRNIYILKHNGAEFDSANSQVLTYPVYDQRWVSITEDHQYLTVADEY